MVSVIKSMRSSLENIELLAQLGPEILPTTPEYSQLVVTIYRSYFYLTRAIGALGGLPAVNISVSSPSKFCGE